MIFSFLQKLFMPLLMLFFNIIGNLLQQKGWIQANNFATFTIVLSWVTVYSVSREIVKLSLDTLRVEDDNLRTYKIKELENIIIASVMLSVITTSVETFVYFSGFFVDLSIDTAIIMMLALIFWGITLVSSGYIHIVLSRQKSLNIEEYRSIERLSTNSEQQTNLAGSESVQQAKAN